MSSQIPNPTPDNIYTSLIRDTVADAGGQWIGIQDGIFPDIKSTIAFINPETNHRLVVPFNSVTDYEYQLFDAIQAKIAEDNVKRSDRVISVKSATLQKISKDLLAISAEIDALIERKKS
jgi:hypothetical protein